jgi:hypothetical protein
VMRGAAKRKSKGPTVLSVVPTVAPRNGTVLVPVFIRLQPSKEVRTTCSTRYLWNIQELGETTQDTETMSTRTQTAGGEGKHKKRRLIRLYLTLHLGAGGAGAGRAGYR